VFPTLVVTTNDPGGRDENTVLSNLFSHNNPKMSGSVESFDAAGLRDLLRRSVRSKSIHFDQIPDPISPSIRRQMEEQDRQASFQEAYITGLLKDGDWEGAVETYLNSLVPLDLVQAFGAGGGRTQKSDRALAEAEVKKIAAKHGIPH
jgi:hypothetical protein